MSERLSFLGHKYKAAIVATISLGVLLLLPASFGFGGTIIIQEAFGQFNLPLLEEETEEEENGGIVVEEEEETEETTTATPATPAAPADTTTATVQDLSTYLMADVNVDSVRGFIGSSLPTQGAGGNALTPEGDTGYVVTGPFRVFANETLLRRLVAEMNVAAVDGSSFHNITIQEGAPHRFQVTAGNATTAAGSHIVGSIYLNGSPTPVIDNVPMRISISGQVLAIEDIDIDETRITDPGQRDIISILDGQTIYGSIPST